jgi:chromosome transmission fidelity protein 18
VLTRPLLCICNDVYASSLRELRPLVQVIEVGATAPDKLAARLKEICRTENLLIAPDAIGALVKHTDCDIRSCLNTLQFIKAQSGPIVGRGRIGAQPRRRITADIIQKAAVGSKDETRVLFDIWGSVFSTTVTRAGIAAATVARAPDCRDALGLIWKQAGAHASDARVMMAGLHENLLSQDKGSGPSIEDISGALDWLCVGEELLSKVQGTQQFSLSKYLPAAAFGVHSHCAGEGRFRSVWPRIDSALRYKHDMRQNVLQTFMHGRASAPGALVTAGALDTRATLLDMISPLVTIANPTMRSVNISLMTSREQRDVRNLVDILCTNGLEFGPAAPQSVRGQGAPGAGVGADAAYALANGGPQVVLLPAIEQLISFEDAEGHSPYDSVLRGEAMSDVMRDLVAHEIRLTRLKLSRLTASAAATAEAAAGGDGGGAPAERKAGALPEHVKRQLAASGADGAGAAAAAAVLAFPASAERTQGANTFLAQAAARFRESQIARQRGEISKREKSRDEEKAAGSTAAALAAGLSAPAALQTQAEANLSRSRYAVVFRFQEGHSSAVKRSLRMADL